MPCRRACLHRPGPARATGRGAACAHPRPRAARPAPPAGDRHERPELPEGHHHGPPRQEGARRAQGPHRGAAPGDQVRAAAAGVGAGVAPPPPLAWAGQPRLGAASSLPRGWASSPSLARPLAHSARSPPRLPLLPLLPPSLSYHLLSPLPNPPGRRSISLTPTAPAPSTPRSSRWDHRRRCRCCLQLGAWREAWRAAAAPTSLCCPVSSCARLPACLGPRQPSQPSSHLLPPCAPSLGLHPPSPPALLFSRPLPLLPPGCDARAGV